MTTYDQLVQRMLDAQNAYAVGGYGPGVAARFNAAAEAEFAVTVYRNDEAQRLVQGVIESVFCDLIDSACNIVRSDN